MRVPLPAARMMAAILAGGCLVPENSCSFQNLHTQNYPVRAEPVEARWRKLPFDKLNANG